MFSSTQYLKLPLNALNLCVCVYRISKRKLCMKRNDAASDFPFARKTFKSEIKLLVNDKMSTFQNRQRTPRVYILMQRHRTDVEIE